MKAMKHVIKTFILSFLCMTPLVWGGCSDNGPDKDTDDSESSTADMIAVNMTSSTENPDVLLMCDDGSNVLLRIDEEKGHGIIRYELGSGDDSFVATVVVNEAGMPDMMECEGYRFFFRNINDEDYDYAIADAQGEINYYWDTKFTFDGTENTRSLSGMWDSVTSPFKNWYRDVSAGIKSFSWDDHSKKMLTPYLLKVGAFALTAIYTVVDPTYSPSALLIAINEGYKSGMWGEPSEYFEDAVTALGFIDGQWDGKKWILKFDKSGFFSLSDIFDYFINQAISDIDKMYVLLASYDKEMGPVFDSEEWQIKLSESVIHAAAESAVYEIAVKTEANWCVEGGNAWCRASRQGDNVRIEVDDYEGVETRTCSFTVKTVTYSNEIPDARFFVNQDGILFKIEPTSLTFSAQGTGLSRGVAVTTNENITSWNVTSYPDWIDEVELSSGSFFIEAEENKTGEIRTGQLTVTGYVKGGTHIDRVVSLTQLADGWDGTSWSFSGTVRGNIGGEVYSDNVNYETGVINIAKRQINQFSPNEISMRTDDQGRLIIESKHSFSGDGVSGNEDLTMTLERTGDTTAKCYIKDKGSIRSDGVVMSFSIDGELNGVLVNSGESAPRQSAGKNLLKFRSQFF